MSEIKFNLGPYVVSFDTGIDDSYIINELDPENREIKYRTQRGVIPVKFTIYRAIVANEAKNDGIYIQLWQFDRPMDIADKRELYKNSVLSYSLQGLWQTNSQPHLIDGMEGLVALFTPPEKKELSFGEYVRAILRDDHVYLGSYWPDESKQGPQRRNFSVWCSLISTYPWEGGAKNILDSLKVRNIV